MMKRILTFFWNTFFPQSEHLIEIFIFRDALIHNFRLFAERFSKTHVVPVLKSNAYGHGLLLVARALEASLYELNAPFVVVDSYYEVRQLRRGGFHFPILVIGYTPASIICQNLFLDVRFVVTDLEHARQISQEMMSKKMLRYRRPILLHVKVDIGMHRQGILPHELESLAELLHKKELVGRLLVEGLCSHFADADGASDIETKKQIDLWNKVVARARLLFSSISFTHIAASAGSLFSEYIDANVVRLGIGLYGISTLSDFSLRPALEMRSRIVSIREIELGEGVGYNFTFRAFHKTRIALVPAGYYEGVDRRLSNKGSVLVGDVLCPIIGRVSMNMMTIDVSLCANVHVGDNVILMSADTAQPNSVESIARTCATIPYEIVVHIPPHLKRNLV